MAERGYTHVTVIPLFASKSLSAGETGTSGIIDLREQAQRWVFSLDHSNAAGTSTTCGTTVFTYVGASDRDGSFVTPVGGFAIGTSGPAIAGKIASFSPALVPFIKIVATQTGADTKGANSKVTASLIVQ